MTIETRELKSDEFYLAEKLWEQYHGQKADPGNERIFGVFVDGNLAASARYVMHSDGVEMDCVFVPNPGPDPVLQDRWVLPYPRRPAPKKYQRTVLILPR